MQTDKLNRLKEVLSIPTVSRNETLMIEYLKKVLTEKGYDHTVDRHGNVYVTKGKAEWFPCFIAHTDTVHSIDHGLTVIETREGNRTILTGMNKDTGKASGIGGDDKCGVFLCLEMLDTLDNVKVALFVSEEIGCQGSKHADPEFFENVGYAIQYDSPEGDSMSFTLMSKELFGKESEFGTKVSDLIIEHGVTKWARHPYTDIWQLLEKFDFSCLNLAAGYYNMHRSNEYVIVEDVDNAYELGLKLISNLGENKYERPKEVVQEPTWWGGGNGGRNYYETATILNEGEQDEDDYGDLEPISMSDLNGCFDDGAYGNDGKVTQEYIDYLRDCGFELIEEEEPTQLNTVNLTTLEWEDLWDYEDFNGDNSNHWSSLNDRDWDW